MTVTWKTETAQMKEPEPPLRSRNQDIDVLKGVAILMVVFGHVLRGLHETGIGSEPLFEVMDPRFYAVHVQLLFLLSGVLSYGSLVRKGPAFFAKSRFSEILLPLVLWTYLFMGIKVLAGPFQNQTADLSDVLILPFPGHLHLWFLWALFLMQLCAAAVWGLARSFSSTVRQGILILAFVLSLAALAADLGSTSAYWIGNARHYLPFFLLGMILAAIGTMTLPRNGSGWVAVALFWAAFAFVPTLSDVLGNRFAVSMLLCSSAIWAGRRLIIWGGLTCPFVVMGQATMAIYLLHVIFAAATREFLMAAGVEAAWLHTLAGLLAGVGLPLLVSFTAPTKAKRVLMIA